MQFWVDFLELCKSRMERPTNFGWFHVMFLVASILVGILLCLTHKKGDDRRVRRAVFVSGVIVILLEIYKLFIYSFSASDGMLIFDFQWYVFPWQFCSMPMYVSVLSGVFRKGKVHNSLMAFLGTYAIFAGLCVMLYPNDVFTAIIGNNIQTMVCHGAMLSIGIYLYGSGYVKAEHKTILRALPVFATAAGIAILLNEVFYKSGILQGEVCNLFYFSPYFPGTLPVYSTVQGIIPYPWSLIIYIVVFTLAAYVMLLGAIGICKLVKKAKKTA